MAGKTQPFSFQLFSYFTAITTSSKSASTIPSYSTFMRRTISQVPIISLLGATPQAQKVRANVYNYYPYFYAEFPEKLAKPEDTEFLGEFAFSVEKAYCSLVQLEGAPKEDFQVIHAIEVVDSNSIYGYHKNTQKFIKISLYDPETVGPVAKILNKGCVFEHEFEVYEVHLNYAAKFFRDCDLAAFDTISLKKVPQKVEFSHEPPFTPPTTFSELDVSQIMEFDCDFNDIIRHPGIPTKEPMQMPNSLKPLLALTRPWENVVHQRLSSGVSLPSLSTNLDFTEPALSASRKDLISKCLKNTSEATPEKYKPWTVIQGVNYNVLRTCKTSPHYTMAESVKEQEENIVMEGLEEKEVYDIMDVVEKKEESKEKPKKKGRKRGLSNNMSIMEYFSTPDKENEDNSVNDEGKSSPNGSKKVKKIYTVHRKTGNAKTITSLAKIKGATKVTCYEMKSTAPSSLAVKNSIASTSHFICYEDAHFTSKEDYLMYSSGKQQRFFHRVKHPVKLAAKHDIPQFVQDRDIYMRYEKTAKVRCSELYESPSMQPYIYTMNRTAPSTKSIIAKGATADVVMRNAEEVKTVSKLSIYTSMWIEVYCCISHNRPYNPSIDPVTAIFVMTEAERGKRDYTIIEVAGTPSKAEQTADFVKWQGVRHIKVRDEAGVFKELNEMLDTLQPDALFGYDTQRLSIGYLIQRAASLGNIEMDLKSRILGRTIFDCMKALNYEKRFKNLEYESVMYEIFCKVEAKYTAIQLRSWYADFSTKSKVYSYFLNRITGSYEIMKVLGVLEKHIDFLKTYGFDSALTNRERFEQLLMKASHKLNYLLKSRNTQQIINQDPLFVEPFRIIPKSDFYVDPVIILKVHLLYPSVVISHNLCYSTLIGRFKQRTIRRSTTTTCNGLKEAFGYAPDKPLEDAAMEQYISDSVLVAPNSVVFVKPSKREGVLPKLLKEILLALASIGPSNNTLYKYLEKTANAVYEYADTSLKNKMGCPELADSIAAFANQRISSIVDSIHTNSECKVIQGDTNELVVHLPGKSVQQAYEIANKIIAENSFKLKLSLKKVLCPYLVVSKECFAGTEYTPSPKFVQKGLENIAPSNTCPYVPKVLTKALQKLFQTKDFSEVKKLVSKKMEKIMARKLPVPMALFNRSSEFANSSFLASAFKKLAPIPRLRRDEDRIQYIVVDSGQNQTLKDSLATSEEVLRGTYQINARYYLYKQLVPALDTLFRVFGIETQKWVNLETKLTEGEINNCVLCGEKCYPGKLCENCKKQPIGELSVLESKLKETSKNIMVRMSCCGNCNRTNDIFDDEAGCMNINCLVYRDICSLKENIRILKDAIKRIRSPRK